MKWRDLLGSIVKMPNYKTDEEFQRWLERQTLGSLHAREALWVELRQRSNEQLGYLSSKLACALGLLYGLVDRPLTHFNAVLLLTGCIGYFAFRVFAVKTEARMQVLRQQLGLLREEE